MAKLNAPLKMGHTEIKSNYLLEICLHCLCGVIDFTTLSIEEKLKYA